MDPISTFNVHEVFTYKAPPGAEGRFIDAISREFVAVAQCILYNVPDSQERVDALKLLYDSEMLCISRIKQG